MQALSPPVAYSHSIGSCHQLHPAEKNQLRAVLQDDTPLDEDMDYAHPVYDNEQRLALMMSTLRMWLPPNLS